MAAPNLQFMLAESVDFIAGYLYDDIQSLLALRATCRDMRDKLTYQFAERVFSTLGLDMNMETLQCLLDILENTGVRKLCANRWNKPTWITSGCRLLQ